MSFPEIPGVGIDTSPLHRRKVFQSSSLQEAQSVVCKWIAKHELRAGRGEVDARLFAMTTGRLQLMMLRYGPEVEVQSRSLDEFSLVQIPLRGTACIDCDGHQKEIGYGQSALLSPKRSLRLKWSADSEQLILRVPNEILRATAVSNGLPESSFVDSGQAADPIIPIEGADFERWGPLVQSLIASGAPSGNNGGSQASHPAWVRHCETGLALFLATLQEPPSRLGYRENTKSKTHRTGAHPFRAALEYVQSNLPNDITPQDIAKAAGVSERSVQAYVKASCNLGTMQWVRSLRLELARDYLKRRPDLQVSEVARLCGIAHLGRFSAYYRRRFGELPSETAVLTCGLPALYGGPTR